MRGIFFYAVFLFFGILTLQSCANMAQGPTGGLQDITPPEYQKSTPLPNGVNYRDKRIEITFDEYIVLDNPAKLLVVSPPQSVPPIARGIGKRVVVDLQDSLLANTTYTLDFGNSIVDNNERNPLSNYVFSFSTGPDIDTMAISGTVLHASNLAPVPDVYVGVYSNLEDTAFSSSKFERIARTDDRGRFVIRNLAVKPYRVYALHDVNNNYFFDQKTEGLAVLDGVVTPRAVLSSHLDTIYRDSVTIDTIVTHHVVRYLPDSLLLRFFYEDDLRQFFIKAERNEPSKFTLFFKNITKRLPVITLLDFDGERDWLIPEPSVTRDTLLYWIRDSVIFNRDTLRFLMDYEKTDSLGVLIPVRDTVTAVFRGMNVNARRERRNGKGDTITFSTVQAMPAVVEYFNKPVIVWKVPLQSIDRDKISLSVKEDTLWNDVAVRLLPDTLGNPRAYLVMADMVPGSEYRLWIDSAAVTDIYGNHNKREETRIRVRMKDDYANLSMVVRNAPENAFMELLGKNDVPVRKVPVVNGKGVFELIQPGEYFVRMVADRNGNGKWDTGNFKEGISPEVVFYFNKKIRLRANWDVEEEWDVTATPLLLQRMGEIQMPKTSIK